MQDPSNIVTSLCKSFVARANDQCLKGKKRDVAALEFFLGAARAAQLTAGDAHPITQGILSFAAFAIAIRGYGMIEDRAKQRLTSDRL